MALPIKNNVYVGPVNIFLIIDTANDPWNVSILNKISLLLRDSTAVSL